MSGIKAIDTYHREALERAYLNVRQKLHDKTQELESLKVRSEQAILDTARCAALTSAMASIHEYLSLGEIAAAGNVAHFALEND